MLQTATASLGLVLDIISGTQNKQDRTELTLLLGKVSQQLTDDFGPNCRTLGVTRESTEASLSLVMTIRSIWAMTPEMLFTAADPDFEKLARMALEGNAASGSSTRLHRSLSIVYRRLRHAHKFGRRHLTSLDLTLPSHEQLLSHQHGRCALCRYKFGNHELHFGEDVDVHSPSYGCDERPGEVALRVYRRRPVLDHIVPQFLGGDDPENWQVLCESCNSGKGEGITWIMRKGFLPPMRPSETFSITASVRYAVLSRYCSINLSSLKTPSETGELRLYRINDSRLPVFDNLYVKPDLE